MPSDIRFDRGFLEKARLDSVNTPKTGFVWGFQYTLASVVMVLMLVAVSGWMLFDQTTVIVESVELVEDVPVPDYGQTNRGSVELVEEVPVPEYEYPNRGSFDASSQLIKPVKAIKVEESVAGYHKPTYVMPRPMMYPPMPAYYYTWPPQQPIYSRPKRVARQP
jgi:hypothetical protein